MGAGGNDIDVPSWVARRRARPRAFCGARVHDFAARAIPFLRLGFTYHDESELADAARRMARALAQQ